MKHIAASTLITGLLLCTTAMAQTNLRYAMQDDPDTLDPHISSSTASTVVLNAICDRLWVLDAGMNLVPALATKWSWSADNKQLSVQLREGVTFHDGTPFDAEALKFNIERAKTMPESQRKDDVTQIDGVDVTGPFTATIRMKAPDMSIMAKFAERIGMMVSPAAAKASGAQFGRSPVCSGPYKFVERVAQDRTVIERNPAFWDKANYFVDRITFRTIPDGTIRLANLQAGALDVMDRLDPTDVPTVQKDARLKLLPIDTLNYQSIVINVAKTPKADNPMGRDPRVREAFELALDRAAIVQVAFNGLYTAGNQFVAPDSPYYDKASPMPKRDLEKARKILKDAGYSAPVPFEMTVPNRPITVRVGEMIQAMVNEAGFDLKLKVVEFVTSIQQTDAGDFQSWGPIGPQTANDPDAVTFMSLHSIGSRNVGKYSSPEMDKLMVASRTESDPEKRRAIFHQAAQLIAKDRPVIYLYHQRPFYVTSAKVTDVTPMAGGFMLFRGMKLAS